MPRRSLNSKASLFEAHKSLTVWQVGTIPPGAVPVLVTDVARLEHVKPGEVVSFLGDNNMQWDEECLPPSKLEPWRHEGDPLCDEVVRALELRPGQDGLQVLQHHLELPVPDQAECVKLFWHEISRLPPHPISALPSHSMGATPRSTLASTNYHPPPTLAEGQAVFWRYSSQIFYALFHYSLAGGFSAVRVVNVLRETNYLTGHARDAAYRRLLETTQAVLDYMTDLTPVSGIGWKSAVRVRMLHASVRVRLRDRKGIKNVYDEKVDGLPINQEDLLGTLGSFSIAPLWSLRRIGMHLSNEEEEAYIAVWRHIGYYLGISPSRLAYYYASPSPVARASKLFACITMHLFTDDVDPSLFASTSTYRLLACVAGRAPRYTSISYHIAISRFLLGDGLANRLGLPMTTRSMALRTAAARWIEWSLVAFGRMWTRRWEVERVMCTRTLISMLVCWHLGSRRTRFTIKTFAADMVLPQVLAVEKGEEEGHKAGTGEQVEKSEKNPLPSEAELNPDDDELDQEVQLGSEAGKRIVSRWRWLLAEMAAVVLSPVMVAGLVGMWIWRVWGM